MTVLTPHFDLPFRLGSSAAVVEQGTTGDVANCVYMICATPRGYRDEAPQLGIDDLTFDTPPVMKEAVRTSISQQEPRSDLIFSEVGGSYDLERIVKIALAGRS